MATRLSGAVSSTGAIRIALDARFIGLAGIGRMIAGLWSGLVDLGADVVGLWPGGPSRDWMGLYRAVPPGRYVTVRARPFLPAEQFVLPPLLHRIHADVHHAPHCAVPYLAGRPLIVTIHDLFPYLDRANARSSAAAAMYRVAFPLAIRHADVVVAVSAFTARQIAETFSVDAARLRVVEHGLDQARWRPPEPAEVEAVRTRYRLPAEYFLYVGTAKRHKNLKTLLAAQHPAHPPLVLAGPGEKDLHEAGLSVPDPRRVIALGRVPDGDLASLYGGALALALPSLYEAVGFTALEAMACGTAVVCSDGGGLPDTVGAAGLVVPALDVSAWSEALTRVSQEDALCNRLAAQGRAAVARRSWRTAAAQYLDIYREAAA
jgi:glycosyltransferase involved in cell wall biosynthesis